MNRRESLLALGLAAFPALSRAETPIPLARDLREDGRVARAAVVPIVILFSLPGCPYCEEIRRSHLAPMLRDPKQASRAIVRQVDVNGAQAITGFRGEATTHGATAGERGVKRAPVVQFWSPEGTAIVAPLVGMLLPDFYAAYFESALEAAKAALKAKA